MDTDPLGYVPLEQSKAQPFLPQVVAQGLHLLGIAVKMWGSACQSQYVNTHGRRRSQGSFGRALEELQCLNDSSQHRMRTGAQNHQVGHMGFESYLSKDTIDNLASLLLTLS